jgi:hypothetical protein
MGGGESQRYLGWVLVSFSAVAWSTAGYFTRLIDEDVWTMLFWRGVFGGLAFAVMAVMHYRGKVLHITQISAAWAFCWRSSVRWA